MTTITTQEPTKTTIRVVQTFALQENQGNDSVSNFRF